LEVKKQGILKAKIKIYKNIRKKKDASLGHIAFMTPVT
jgi:hypothetical protein